MQPISADAIVPAANPVELGHDLRDDAAVSHRPLRLDPHPLDLRGHPNFTRREFAVPDAAVFDHRMQFTCLRSFRIEGGRLVDWRRQLDDETQRLGRVIWPHFDTLFAENFWELVDEIKRRGLYLFDIWGHVPGSDTVAAWSHVVPPPGMVQRLRQELGDRFLGIDNGEQDGRYIWRYAAQQCPSTDDRVLQAANFHRFFRRLGDDLGNQLSVLISLSFVHHLAQEGNHLLLGAETAQALPNAQVYYAFIRGAGVQYGVPWFGNVSYFNRWGWKTYDGEGKDPHSHYVFGPEQGTSLSLMRRLLYTQILYNCSLVGFEGGWCYRRGDDPEVPSRLTPIGEVQAAAVRWAEAHPDVGLMLRPVGIMLDHFSGWTVPRHLYTSKVYQVWGAAPYDQGDFLTHGLLSMLYPGYEDASFYHDERGFLAATPYSDCADVLLTDAPLAVLQRYDLLIMGGRVRPDAELASKLQAYVRGGGELIVTAGPARELFPELRIDLTNQPTPTCLIHRLGDGQLTVLPSQWGVVESTGSVTVSNQIDRPLPNPCPLQRDVVAALDLALRSRQLFVADPRLGLIICRRSDGHYIVGVHNNQLNSLPLRIQSRIGPIRRIQEWPIEPAGVGAAGYWPTGFTADLHVEEGQIAAGDIRIFEIELEEPATVTWLGPVTHANRPRDRFLSLPVSGSLVDALHARPTFFQHFDGIKLDWRWLRERDRAAVQHDAAWARRQQLRVMVDLSSGLNFYPDLTLLDTFAPRYAESQAMIADVLDKAQVLGAEALIATLHIQPENHCPWDEAGRRFVAGAQRLADLCRERQMTLYLQAHPDKWIKTVDEVADFIRQVQRDQVRLALNIGHWPEPTPPSPVQFEQWRPHVKLVLASAAHIDRFGQWYDQHRPAAEARVDWSLVRSLNVPIVIDSADATWDAVYRDIQTIWPKETCA